MTLENLKTALLAATALATLSGFGAASRAWADDAAPAVTSADANIVAEVTVSARHRDESLQKVPLAVSVMEGSEALSKSLNGLQDISSQIPAVDFRTSSSNKDRTIFVRGVGTISTSPGVEPSVSTVVDGVVMARAGQATVDLLDLDRVEVLQGPQGTLFGKNATAGVINITTRAPTATPAGYLDASAFQGNEYRLGGSISGPLAGDRLKGLLSAFTSQYEGNVDNLATGKKINGYRHTGVRGKLVANPTDTLTLTLSADYTRSKDVVPNGVFADTNRIAYPTNAVTANAPLASLLSSQGITASNDNTSVSNDVTSTVADQNGGTSVQADWDFAGGYRLTSITAYRTWRNVQHQDFDQLSVLSSSFPQVADTGRLAFNQVSQELRIASPKGQFVDYVVGAFYMNAKDRETYLREVSRVVSGSTVNDNGRANYGSKDENYSLFGEANVNFSSNFRAIAGFREIHDDLSYYHARVSTSATAITGVGVSYASQGSISKDGYAGRLGLQYDLNDRVSTYATYSRGYMGPAYNVFFNMAAVNTPPLNPETSNSYEVGLKSQLFDRRVQTNLVAYATDFDNYQANFTQSVGGALVTNLINAGSVTSRGAAADITAKPAQGLTLTANVAYNDAHIVSFTCPAGSPVSCNINGKPLPFAPKWKSHLQIEYKVPVSAAMNLAFESDYNWQTKTQYQLTQLPATIQPAYGILNASVALINPGEGWSARLLIKNIGDQHYSSFLGNGNVAGLVRWVPRDDARYIGINAHKDF